MKNNNWIKLVTKQPNTIDNGERVLLYRINNIQQKNNEITVHETIMVKHCDPNETYQMELPEKPII